LMPNFSLCMSLNFRVESVHVLQLPLSVPLEELRMLILSHVWCPISLFDAYLSTLEWSQFMSFSCLSRFLWRNLVCWSCHMLFDAQFLSLMHISQL
jgi:hypothetical protein